MRAPEVIVLDFETWPIRRRPQYPPGPVGLAVATSGEGPQYLTGKTEIMRALEWAWRSPLPILCHHAKFDLAVACERLGLPMLPWERVHDTMFLAYLCDPHSRSLGLKELAADVLGWPAEEQSELDAWIWEHRRELEAQYPDLGKVKKSQLGAWIHAAPVELVSKYACGDVARTRALFEHLWPIVQQNDMGAAYDRERRLLPILMDNERIGLRVAQGNLERDIDAYSQHYATAEDWLRHELRASELNFDADADVSAILLERGIVPLENWSHTANGQLSMSKEALLPEHFTGPNGSQIASALGYRNRLKTCLDTFMRPWAAQAAECKGHIHPNWNQVKGERGGTRTGRPSCTDPNLLNLSKSFDGRSDGYVHPEFLGVAPLPLVRRYVLPDEGGVWLHRDFSGQELRVFADFEQGDLWQEYQRNPSVDVHDWVRGRVKEFTGVELERTRVKNVTFSRLYGGGLGAIQRQARCQSRTEAQQIANYHDAALPGRKRVVEEITRIARRGDPIRTWGGRLYFSEPPGVDGRDKIYKLINYAVQGSAADLTKEALIEWHETSSKATRFLVTVYDEINISAEDDGLGFPEQAMAHLRSVMEQPRLSVPMLSDGKRGPTWGDLTKCP